MSDYWPNLVRDLRGLGAFMALVLVVPALLMAIAVAALVSVYPYVMWPLLLGVIVFLRYRESITNSILNTFDRWNEVTAEKLLQHLRIKSR